MRTYSISVSKKINKKDLHGVGYIPFINTIYTMHFLKARKQSCHVIQHSTFLSSAVSDINFNMQPHKKSSPGDA